MDLPTNSFFNLSLTVKAVYYFESDKINTTEPHYYVVISIKDDRNILLAVSTSQFQKRKKFIELNKHPLSTLVRIKPNKNNGLTKESFFDCNSSCFVFSKDELINIFKTKNIKYKGLIKDSELEQIKQGIKDSFVIEENIKELIK